jgi:hypothetical protein
VALISETARNIQPPILLHSLSGDRMRGYRAERLFRREKLAMLSHSGAPGKGVTSCSDETS